MLSIPTRLAKMLLAGCCGLGATALFVAGKYTKSQELVYASYGTAGAAAILAGQAVLPGKKDEE